MDKVIGHGERESITEFLKMVRRLKSPKPGGMLSPSKTADLILSCPEAVAELKPDARAGNEPFSERAVRSICAGNAYTPNDKWAAVKAYLVFAEHISIDEIEGNTLPERLEGILYSSSFIPKPQKTDVEGFFALADTSSGKTRTSLYILELSTRTSARSEISEISVAGLRLQRDGRGSWRPIAIHGSARWSLGRLTAHLAGRIDLDFTEIYFPESIEEKSLSTLQGDVQQSIGEAYIFEPTTEGQKRATIASVSRIRVPSVVLGGMNLSESIADQMEWEE